MRIVIYLLLFTCFEIGFSQNTSTVFFLVRHAEKAKDDTKDPPLSSVGMERANQLAFLLQQVGLSAIYSTPYKRTKETAAPLAARLGLTVQPYEPFKEGLLKSWKSVHVGEKVLVVGHSNTIPSYVNKLVGSELQPLGENDYDQLFVIICPASVESSPSFFTLRY